MGRPAWGLAAAAFCLAAVPAVRGQGPPAGDLAFRGGVVHTMDPAGTRAEALVAREGRIVWIGGERELSGWIDADTRVVDLQGGMLLPGFQDAHVHPMAGGMELGDCDLNEVTSRDEVLASVAACHAELPAGEWLRGGGFLLPLFAEGNPRATTLDAIVGDRPAFLTSADAHTAWVSSAALRAAGITADTPDPPAGRIERDESGAPAGALRESAVGLVERLLPPRSRDDRLEGLARGLALAAGFGITGLQEASASAEDLRAYADAADQGELTARLSVSLRLDPDRGLDQLVDLVRLRDRYRRPGLRVGTVKIFADGVLEAQTAALLEPYVHRQGYRGEATYSREELVERIVALDALGFQVHVHAIGDRAIRDALDGFEEARRRNGAREARHHIAHAQLIDPADLPRFGRLHAYATFSPLWAQADTYVTELTDPFIGPARAPLQYPLADLARAGGRFACGSDWTVSSMNPLLGIETGMRRVAPEAGAEEVPWLPQQRVDLDTMLACYTIQGARVNFLDAVAGSLEVGKSADLVWLERDLAALEPSQVGETSVRGTWLAGKLVFSRPPQPRSGSGP